MNPFKRVDEFFEVFIEDGFGRSVLCHIPFWGFCILASWNILFYLLPWVFIFVVVGLLIPHVLGSALFKVYKVSEEEISHIFLISSGLYFLALVVIVGVPFLYEGLIMEFIKGSSFNKFYWRTLAIFWDFLNAINPLSDTIYPRSFYEFKYRNAHIVLSVSFFGVAPLNCFLMVREFESEKREQAKKEIEEERELQRKLEISRKKEERERVLEAERLKEEENRRILEKEREVALLKKRKSVEGKDPWNSGFL